MKRLLSIVIILLLLPLCACSEGFSAAPAQSLAPGQTASPAPAPALSKKQVIALFGAEDAPAFVSGLTEAADASSVTIEQVKGGIGAMTSYVPQGDTVAIVYLSGTEQSLPAVEFPVYAFAANGQSVSGGIPYLGYDGTGEAKLALDEAIAYPPHLTPVRMIGLFTSQTSAVYTLWSAQKTAARVFAKEEFFADASETALADWLNEAMTRYYPGMLDAIYAETGELAIAAADVLASLGRSDIEVFSAGSDTDVYNKLSPILVYAAGANLADAGAKCFAEASKLFAGEAAQSSILLPESFWYSENK